MAARAQCRDDVAYSGIAMGIALLLTGIGFLVLTLGGVLKLAPGPTLARRGRSVATATN